MKILRIFFIVLGGFVVLGAPAFAREAHVHGLAHMNVGVEGEKVEIKLVSPLANVISFEYRPETDAQKKEVRNMAAVMRKADSLFVLSAEAGCRLKEVSLESGVMDDCMLSSGGAGCAEIAHARHEGGKREAHEHGASGDHDHGHAGLEVEVSFMCRHPEKLNSMKVDLFRVFPNLHEMEVQMVIPGGQKAAELTPESNTLRW
ncbi:MAG: DUF2796 domain-containing protein [Candidatus Accumulibacter sp.]|nr:DUF2796 domain-containing protein [Accumulibacter sp.]